MQLSIQQLGLIQQYFLKQPVLKAYLFGSYVRGTARDQSDIDLLIELDYAQLIGLEFVQMQLDLQLLLAKKVDLVSANGVSKYIQPIIDAEKRLIYARPIGGENSWRLLKQRFNKFWQQWIEEIHCWFQNL